MKKIVLVGGGGHAISVVDVIQSVGEYDICGVVDLNQNIGKQIMGHEIIGTDDSLVDILNTGVKYSAVTIGSVGNTALRKMLYYKLKKIGFTLPNIIDPSAVVSKNAILGEGIFIGKKVVVNAGCKIGDMSIINTASVIEHGCNIGKFTHISSNAVVCGDVTVGNDTHIGANATVIEGLSIGQGTLIGAGSVVTHDIADHTIAYGNPCKEVSS
ncbi:MAG: acetyltransferase [Peptococcaceae bacterium]|nr:acetyltransferase [Peptococcaceae bacterium]